YLFDVNWSDAALYDLVINTERLSFEAGVDLIRGLFGRPEVTATDGSRQALRDPALASRGRVAPAAHSETRQSGVAGEAGQGVTRPGGPAARGRAREVGRAVPGVVDVKEQPLEVPPIPPFVA